MANRYGLYTATFGAGEDFLKMRQVRSLGTRTGKNMRAIHASGDIDPSKHLLSTARPILSVATHDMKRVFADADAPVSITAGLIVDAVATFMYRRRLPGGAYDPGSFHTVQTCDAGFLHVTEISAECESQDPAECMLEFVALSTDGKNPFDIARDQEIPSDLATPLYNSAYFHGPAYFNSSQLPGLIRTRVRPGIEFKARHCDGGAFARADASSINKRSPQIELEFLKVDMADLNIGDLLVNSFSNTLAVYFQLAAENNEGRVADATAEHLKISAAAGTWGAEDVSVADENDATITVLVEPDGVLSLSAASAIP